MSESAIKVGVHRGLKALAAQMGVKPVFSPSPFAGLLGALALAQAASGPDRQP